MNWGLALHILGIALVIIGGTGLGFVAFGIFMYVTGRWES